MPQERLDSWKAVAAYLKRDVTTVQRWERREGMPVHRHVHDKRGSVYALVTELDAWRQSRAALLASDQEPAAAAKQDAPEGPRSPWSRRTLLLLLLAVALLALSALLFTLYRHRATPALPPRIASLAVLPLRNLSGDPAQEYLADGMTEALIGRLARIHNLRVISHTSVMRFRDPQASVPEIGRMLGADAIVEGSVTRVGNQIRVTAQLIRAASDEHFWSETYDRDMRDALGLQSELAQSIAERVEVTVSGDERQRLTAARSVAPEVYESYLKGQFAFNGAQDQDGIKKSIQYFENASQLDPTFAPAYLGLARAYDTLGTVELGGIPGETRPRVVSAARKAVELDPDLADAYLLLANVDQEQWHWREAELENRRALDLSPNDAKAHWQFALWLACQGRTEEAQSWVERGRRLDPLAVSGDSTAWILFLSRRYDQAVRELQSDLALQPDNAGARTTLGFLLSASNHDAQAIPQLEKAVADSKGSPAAMGVLIRAYARAGRRSDALRLLEALKRRKAAGYVPAAAFVNAYLGLGDTDQSFAWLEQAYAEQSNILQFLKVHPFFDPIRADRRFADLVRRVWRDPAE